MALFMMTSCGDGPPITDQEQWEFLGMNHEQTLIDARLSVGSGGLLRGQGRARLSVVRKGQIPLEYGRDSLADDVSRPPEDGLVIGPDTLTREDGRWALGMRADGLDLRLTLDPAGPPTLPATQETGRGRWSVQAPVTSGQLRGFITAGERDELIDGHGVLLHRWGADPPALRGTERVSIFVLDRDLALGVDQTGGLAVSWIRVGDRTLTHDGGLIRRSEEGWFELDFRPSADVVARIYPRRKPSLRRPVYDALTKPERWLLRGLVGWAVRHIHAAQARVVVAGVHRTAPAMVVAVEYK
ncbi:MAG: hypothetical protein H6739_35710 [Alphaproteobacteria bacterium]|nr:hypothetical protein [Alphaproteobacteria bacterium]